MASYCTKCKINWAALHSQDHEERDETYEFCPKCKCDMWLVDAVPGPQYTQHAISGVIRDVATGEPMPVLWPKPAGPVRPDKPFNLQEWQAKKQKKEDVMNKALEAYTSMFATHGQQAAEAEYFNILKQLQ